MQDFHALITDSIIMGTILERTCFEQPTCHAWRFPSVSISKSKKNAGKEKRIHGVNL